ncbi:MAG TPA: class I adenylate-forming enzyme family protein [Acidimicrobiales bacterium]|nr:class I adenylate-forming enzyme family protein [Acidimicrobiales bacterium]
MERAATIAEAHARLTAPGERFEMAEATVDGQVLRTWKNAPPHLPALLEASRAHGDLAFLVYEDEQLTFEQHFRAAAHLAHVLRDDFGVAAGDRVAIAMRNFPEWSIAFWAAAAAGAVVVPLNAWWTGPELAFGLRHSGSRVAFVDDERRARLDEVRSELGDLRLIVARSDEAVDGVVSGADDLRDLLAGVPDDVVLPDVDLEPEDPATIFYTSGTTGQPKGALGTHRNICTNLVSLGFANARSLLRRPPEAVEAAAAADAAAPSARNTYLLSVPFFHATGCHSILVANLAAGGKIVIMHRWDPERALELIEREQVTTFGGVPSMVWQVLDSPSLATRDISSVRSIGYGGAPAPPELVRRIEAMFPGRTPSNGYGLTETSSVTTMNAGADYIRKPESVGVPVAVCDVEIVDGELWIRGPNVVKGYWDDPEATERTFGDGWLRTGDLARIDDEGFVFIVDRAKDVVIRGGENVYSAEVEAAVFEHPGVADAAVIGVPHQVLGEEVGVVVVRTPDSALTADELQAHVRARLAGFKVPTHVFFREEPLPRNPAGKVLKRALRTEVLP